METSCSSSEKEHKYIINGVPLTFPCKPYPSQIAMINKILIGLCRKQNCLLESPTGSGKSLALLCACLAWQKEEQRKIDEAREKLALKEEENIIKQSFNLIKGSVEKCSENQCKASSGFTKLTSVENVTSPFFDSKNKDLRISSPTTGGVGRCPENQCKEFTGLNEVTSVENVISPFFDIKNKDLGFSSPTAAHNQKRKSNEHDRDDDDFLPSKKYRVPVNSSVSFKNSFLQGIHHPFHGSKPNGISQPSCSESNTPTSPALNTVIPPVISDLPDETAKLLECCLPNSAPKIYFGTRTHKQIEQIVREFKKTSYTDAKMSILSSRERTCIHPVVSRVDNKNEACKELIDKEQIYDSCAFFYNVHHINHPYLCASGLDSGWNLEELINTCKTRKVCPYYAARTLMETADIVFCPYNYLIDPLIRSSLNITLWNSIIVLDEAHNIEDSAREAASLSITQDELVAAIKDLEELVYENIHTTTHMCFAALLSGLSTWIHKHKEDLPNFNAFDTKSRIWTGEELVAILTDIGAGPDNFKDLKTKLTKVTESKSLEETDQLRKMSASTTHLLEGLLLIMSFMYRNKLQFMSDYRAVIVKIASRSLNTSWKSKALIHASWSYTLHLWCLNPAVAFSDFKNNVHSLIVASGTLSPMASFQSELDMPFTVQLEASHVITPSQVWIGTIGKGFDGSVLNASFHNSETYAFQDGLGQLVIKVCKIVPHGVLCFLPSYNMLEKLTRRWQMTGLWEEMLQLKVILCEPRSTDKVNFECILSQYYDAVNCSENKNPEDECNVNGALLFAVCRGKVSEGLDFADNNARAVITVGIPFPNIKDIQVDQKRKYNDRHRLQRSLMSGNDWYETQAFRALNQALGRCLRHKTDWGALILVDERFQRSPRYIKALSKWIRKLVVHYPTLDESMHSLYQFTSSKSDRSLMECLSEPSSPVLFD